MPPVTPTSAARSCPVCSGSSQTHFADERIDPGKISNFTYSSRKQPEFMCLRLVRCLDCDLVYAPMPPATDFLSTAYSEAAYDSGPEAHAAARSYAKALTPYMARLCGRKAAVDVGAGCGPLLPWLCENGFNPVIGIEPSHAAIEAALPEVRPMLRAGMFSPALLADVKPSLLCSFMTLEHLADPVAFVHEAYDLLEPGGMLAVVIHNWRAPLNRLFGLRSPIIDMEHLQLFSPQSIHALLTRAGFVSIDLKSITNAYPLRYWLRLTPLSADVKRRITGVLECLGLADMQVSLPVGNILAIGIKPHVGEQMTQPQDVTTKKNVNQFDNDVRQTGSYAYTANRLSSRFANLRISEYIAQSYDFSGKTVLDLGCGDGTYTLEFVTLGVKEIIGVDPASAAIEAANAKAQRLGVDAMVRFEVGNIYGLDSYFKENRFDCVVLRGVLHHLPDPARAIAALASSNGTIVVLEPNGNNPVLKILEKYSRYHIEHEERSYSPAVIRSWFSAAGFRESSSKVFNLVPMFCPDWMANALRVVGPFIERLPLVRNIACGQRIFVMTKGAASSL